MQSYKYTIAFILAVIICSTFTSCSKDDYSSPLIGQTIEDVNFFYESGSKAISVGNIDLTGFTAISSESWCIARTNGFKLELSVYKNNTENKRIANIQLIDPKDGTILNFKVTQQPEGLIILGTTKYNVPIDGGEITINVRSNVNYEVEIPSSITWISRSSSSSRALTDSKIILKVSQNDSEADRSAEIKISDTETGASQVVQINQEFTPRVYSNMEYVEISPEGGEFEFSVESNIGVKVECNDEGITLLDKTTTDGYNFIQKVQVSALTKNEPKKAKIYIKGSSDNSTLWTIKVNQKCPLSISDTNVKVMVGDSYQLTLQNFTSSSVTWKSSDSSIAKVDKNGKVTGIKNGTATITATTVDGKYSSKVDVKVVGYSVELDCGWSMSMISIGGLARIAIGCTIKNNGNIGIVLTKCSIYKDDTLLSTTTDESLLGELNPGISKGISVNINNVTNGTVIKYVWEYTYKEKTYSYESKYTIQI